MAAERIQEVAEAQRAVILGDAVLGESLVERERAAENKCERSSLDTRAYLRCKRG